MDAMSTAITNLATTLNEAIAKQDAAIAGQSAAIAGMNATIAGMNAAINNLTTTVNAAIAGQNARFDALEDRLAISESRSRASVAVSANKQAGDNGPIVPIPKQNPGHPANVVQPGDYTPARLLCIQTCRFTLFSCCCHLGVGETPNEYRARIASENAPGTAPPGAIDFPLTYTAVNQLSNSDLRFLAWFYNTASLTNAILHGNSSARNMETKRATFRTFVVTAL